MPREIVEIDPFNLSGQRQLYAWCVYPNDETKRTAYLAALYFEDCQHLEAEGKEVADWPWKFVEALGSQRKPALQIIEDAEREFNHYRTAAAIMLERLLEGSEVKVREGAAEGVASEIREYHRRKRERGSQTSASRVLHEMWAASKPVAHLALAFTQNAREALPAHLKKLPVGKVQDLLWKFEENHPDAQVLQQAMQRVPSPGDYDWILDRAEVIRKASIDHPKILVEDADTIQFVKGIG